jgi:alpha-galactosidase
MKNKITLLLLLLFCTILFGQNNPSNAPKIILFVCEHGAARSTIAAAYFNKLAKEQGLNYQAVFRGSAPDATLSVGTIRGLTEDGFDVNNWKPVLVSSKDIDDAAQIITFDCRLPLKDSLSKPFAQWNGIPAISKDYAIARKEIVEKIKGLLSLLSAEKSQNTPTQLAKTPPMGWMTWNYFGTDINETVIREMADAMINNNMLKAGYQYVYIDDGWVGGRDNRNNIIPDAKKFPSGIKALADYVHGKGLKIGIYSDASPYTCEGYTASLHFEEMDAKTFADWGIDYLKYDYCNAPEDAVTAKTRYKTMSDALKKSGRDIVFSICEWGERKPWHWAAEAGGQSWRTTGDVRDKWIHLDKTKSVIADGYGIMDIVDENAPLHSYAGAGKWNDMDMLLVGLYGKKGPSSFKNGVGCNDVEYQSQMSMWCMMASPLAMTNDLRTMNAATKRILLNAEIIAINQDTLGKQCVPKIKNETWNVFLKPLSNGDFAVAIINRSDKSATYTLNLSDIGLTDKYAFRNVWTHSLDSKGNRWSGQIDSHETKVFRLKKI